MVNNLTVGVYVYIISSLTSHDLILLFFSNVNMNIITTRISILFKVVRFFGEEENQIPMKSCYRKDDIFEELNLLIEGEKKEGEFKKMKVHQ